MKPIVLLGVMLIVLGIAGLFLSRITWTETKPVMKLGPLQINSQEDHTVWIPTAAGVVAVLAGLGPGFPGKRAPLSLFSRPAALTKGGIGGQTHLKPLTPPCEGRAPSPLFFSTNSQGAQP